MLEWTLTFILNLHFEIKNVSVVYNQLCYLEQQNDIHPIIVYESLTNSTKQSFFI